MERYAPFAGGSMIEDPNGPLVKYDDAQQAIAEAEQRVHDHYGSIQQGYLRGYEQGQRDERARIRAGVKAIDPVEWALNPEPAVLAVIDAGGKSVPRIITADDPEPGVGSVVLDREGDVWLRFQDGLWRMAGWDAECDFELVWAHSPLRLIHDGGQS